MRALLAIAPLVAVALALAGCNGGGGNDGPPATTISGGLTPSAETPAATATATDTDGLEPGPDPADLEAFREFAPEIEAAVEARDVDFFMDRLAISETTCDAEGMPGLLCQNLDEGEPVSGVWVGLWRSEGILVSPDDYRILLQDYFDALKDPDLYAIAAIDQDAGGLIGGPALFAIVVSTEFPLATTRVFEFVPEDGGWRLHLPIHVGELAEEWIEGECAECYDRWQIWEGQ